MTEIKTGPTIWEKIVHAHETWASPDTGINVDDAWDFKGWIFITVIPLLATAGTWWTLDIIYPLVWFAPVLLTSYVAIWTYHRGWWATWALPLGEALSVFMVNLYVFSVAFSFTDVPGSRATMWMEGTLLAGLTIAWAYGYLVRSHWTLPEIPLGRVRK